MERDIHEIRYIYEEKHVWNRIYIPKKIETEGNTNEKWHIQGETNIKRDIHKKVHIKKDIYEEKYIWRGTYPIYKKEYTLRKTYIENDTYKSGIKIKKDIYWRGY